MPGLMLALGGSFSPVGNDGLVGSFTPGLMPPIVGLRIAPPTLGSLSAVF